MSLLFDPASASSQARSLLYSLFEVAIEAVDPMRCVPPSLPRPPRGRTLVLGAGKASARMARAVEASWDGPLSGLVATRYGHGEPCERIEIVEAGHPVPDDAGRRVAQRMLELTRALGPDDLVLALVSGGGSALMTLPPAGLSMRELRAVNACLLRSGAPIRDINMVRRHLSSIKGGRLAQACGQASVVTLVVSDVPGDDPAVVASGPTVPDGSLPEQALAVLRRHDIPVSSAVLAALQQSRSEPLASLGHREVHVIATAEQALKAAADRAAQWGLEVHHLGGAVEGEAREVAQNHAQMILRWRAMGQMSRPRLLLSGGETTVTVRGQGRGGRNSEYLLALALALKGEPDVHALACDTDGIDGMEDNAGGVIGPDSIQRAEDLGLHPRALLEDNNAYAFLNALGDLVTTGPTRTNVNDFRALLVH